MRALRLLGPAAFCAAVAVSPTYAQDVPAAPEAQDAASAPRVVERAARVRSDDDGGGRAERSVERVRLPEVRPRERVEAPAATAPAERAPAFEEQQGGRRRPSGGGGGGGGRGVGGGSRGDGGSSGGSARPRGGVRAPDGNDGGGQVAQAVPRGRVSRPPTVWASSYGRRYYTGGGGLGYYLYDPWSWYGWGWPAYGAYGAWGWNSAYYGGYGGAYGNYYGGGYGGYGGWATAGVRLKVDARDAEVYVDGYFAGTVDDFDGLWQELRLEDGGHRIEIRKPGFETLTFDVRVMPGRTITYRGRMVPAP